MSVAYLVRKANKDDILYTDEEMGRAEAVAKTRYGQSHEVWKRIATYVTSAKEVE